MNTTDLSSQTGQLEAAKAVAVSPSGKSKKLLITFVAALIAVVIFAALFGWRIWRHAGAGPAEWPPTAVSAMRIQLMDVPASIDTVGSLRAEREVVLAPETEGRVVSIGFEAGQRVEAGRLLVQLFDAPQRADRAAAVARADLAKAQLARSKTLINSGAESRETLETRLAERDQALAAVTQWDARIEQKQVRAPFAGEVGIRRIDLGQYLESGQTIATLTDTSRLFVDFSLPQQSLRWLRVGADVRVTTDAWPEREFTATVDTIEPQIDPDTRNIALRALLPNPDNALRPGMFVNAELVLPSQHDQLVVPTTAIHTTAAGDSVLVIRGPHATTKGQVEYVRVQISRRRGDTVIINKGLQAGDVIVTEGQLKVPPGAQVQVAQLRSLQES
ncbi:MAG: efflux transporter periplasmic adaptor subunit [Gammaproteobacteria bacterium]|nr:efflux transporter periplasmic adaptor subunit [Gammaproteobacteria bacterium]